MPKGRNAQRNVLKETYSVFEDLCEVKGCLEGDNTFTLTSPQVKGRLRAHISFWQKIGAPNLILSIIKEGYRLPFVNIPPETTRQITNQFYPTVSL